MCNLLRGGLLLVGSLGAFAFLTNPFLGVPGVDGSIFYYVAGRLGDGLMPYRDVFDQKGVLMYCIDWLAAWNVNQAAQTGDWCWMAWLLDLGAFCLGFFILLQCLRQVFQDDQREACLTALCILVPYYHIAAIGGNMPEMWILVFSGVAYCLVLRSMRTGRVDSLDAFCMGLCVAAILLLKLNMVVIALPVAAVVMCAGFGRVAAAALGCLVGIAPFFIWYGWVDALPSVWEVYIKYNAIYATHGGRHLLFTRAFWPVLGVVMVNLYACLVEKDKYKHRVLIINLLYLSLTFLVVLVSGGGVRYYGPIVPALAIPLAWFLRRLRVGWFCPLVVVSLFATMGLVVIRNHADRDIHQAYEELRQLGSVLEDRKSVTVLGCDCYAYAVLGATCPGRFPFQGTVAGRSPQYREQMLQDIRAGRSRYLVVPKGILDIPGELGVMWAKKDVEEQYGVISSGRSYAIYECQRATR